MDTLEKTVKVKVIPEKRYKPQCHKCNSPVERIHSYRERTVRDLNIFDAKSFIRIVYRVV